jgi:hypothetical protein
MDTAKETVIVITVPQAYTVFWPKDINKTELLRRRGRLTYECVEIKFEWEKTNLSVKFKYRW